MNDRTIRTLFRSFVPLAVAGIVASCGVASDPAASPQPPSDFIHVSPTDAPNVFFEAIGPDEPGMFR